MSSLADQVYVNLVHYNNWTTVAKHALSADLTVLSGTPPTDLAPSSSATEWVIPRSINQDPHISASEINSWFQGITNLPSASARPARVTIAIANDDGTIVYYYIHDGVVKPRQN